MKSVYSLYISFVKAAQARWKAENLIHLYCGYPALDRAELAVRVYSTSNAVEDYLVIGD